MNCDTQLKNLKKELYKNSKNTNISEIDKIISNVSANISKVKDRVLKLIDMGANLAKGLLKHKQNVEIHNTDLKLAKIHDPQDAKKEIKWHFMKTIDEKYTKIKDPSSGCCGYKAIGYSTSINYPFSIGEIDLMGNFKKIDLKTKCVMKAFRGGLYEFIDCDNNIWKKYPGTKHDYIFGDTYKFVAGEFDNIFQKNHYTKIYKDKTQEILGNQFEKIVKDIKREVLQNVFEEISKNRTIKIGKNDLLKIGGNLKIEVSGNIDIKAGGNIKINGANIYLN